MKASETATTKATSTPENDVTTLKKETSYHIANTPELAQLPELPNGCEAVAATMLLNWAGLWVTKQQVADALPKGEMPYVNDDGAFIGSNPEKVFVGDPYDAGYGIYHAPMAETLNQLLPERIVDMSGSTFEQLLKTIQSGTPVMVWATEQMDAPFLELEWQDEEDQLVEWYQPEHALLLTGWDDAYAYMNDPMTGKEEAYDIAEFRSVWESMGSQAITVK
ncbi:C39 family peptidase [Paenibacillus sp. N3.4]|uniref:C39 family peptidase n=1 Tax=Paenibacillus sp. N3.4 TaxID=2603222 RepID=UPI00164FE7CD|nr:C39 family peptidase [Paenibacillus sp. N3.4]